MPEKPYVPTKLRAGFSLLELVVAISIMVMIMGSMGALSKAVNEGALYSETYGNATQHARVAMERIAASVRNATTSSTSPGLVVVEELVGGWGFPDTLVVWYPERTVGNPDGLPFNSAGPPLTKELRVYCPNPEAPNELLEIRFPTDPNPVPDLSDVAAWCVEAANLKNSNRGVRTVLTNMLRTARVSDLAESERGGVRFNVRYRPSETEMGDYAAGSANWGDLAWPQGIHTENIGLRQAWLRMEFQVVPRSTSVGIQSSEKTAIPFLGSASRLYEVHP